MTHRGPERPRHVRRATGVALGVRRLSIVDVEGGHQPFANEDGTRLGGPERRALQPRRRPRASSQRDGHRFASRCDTEILPHLYEDVRRRVPRAAARQVRRSRSGTDASAGARHRPRPARRQAALLRRGRRPARLRLRAEEPARERARRRPSSTTRRSTPILTLGFVPGPTTPLAACRKLMPGHRLVVDGRQRRVERVLGVPGAALRPSRASTRTAASGCSRSSRSPCGCG